MKLVVFIMQKLSRKKQKTSDLKDLLNTKHV